MTCKREIDQPFIFWLAQRYLPHEEEVSSGGPYVSNSTALVILGVISLLLLLYGLVVGPPSCIETP